MLQPLPAMAAINNAPNSAGDTVVRITAQPEQFCSKDGQISYLPEGVIEVGKHPYLAEWARKRRFIVEQRAEGVTVMIVPPPEIRDIRSAVAELSFFFGLVRRECPADAQTLDVLSTGVQGLELVTDEPGEPDFEFTP